MPEWDEKSGGFNRWSVYLKASCEIKGLNKCCVEHLSRQRWSPANERRKPSAIWLRVESLVEKNKTRGLIHSDLLST
jgi:hypothetical protein